jgi:hypothetical protein
VTLLPRLIAAARSFLGGSTVTGDPQVYKPTFFDRSLRASVGKLTWEWIDRALYQAWLGDPRWLADIYHLIPATSSVIRGIERQVKAGVKSKDFDLEEANDTPQAIELRDELRALFFDARLDLDCLFDGFIEAWWEGGGLIEILWNAPTESPRVPVGFCKVPMQRVRWDRDTGELGFALNPFDWRGVPVSAFPDGTFICVMPDSHVPAFDKRGTYRTILSDWYRSVNVAGWWVQDIEQHDSPTAFLKAGSGADLTLFKDAAKAWGNGGKLVASSKDSDAKFLEKGRSSMVPHQVWEQAFKERMALAFLGATQTVTVAARQGSQQSAGEQGEVADDVQGELWGAIASALNEDLFQVYAVLNRGPEAANDAPLLDVDLDEREDIGLFLDNATKARAIGLTLAESQIRETTGFREPGPGDRPLSQSVPAAEPAATGPQPVPAAVEAA